ncbi:MAG: hypothetical protein WC716_03635 [Chitinophagaceae bacterium]|jgi:hypothetical protein
MRKTTLLLATFIALSCSSGAQIKFTTKVETAWMPYGARLVRVDAGPGWKGYNLDNKQNGFALNLVNGARIKDRFFAGLGLGYLNFEGINGFSLYSDFEFYFLKKKKLNPFLNLTIGYSHLNNQYEGGTGSGCTSYGAGIQYRHTPNLAFSVQTGFLITQQALFYPVRLSIVLNKPTTKKETAKGPGSAKE